MKIEEYGTSGSHWGMGGDDLVVHHGRGQIQLTEGEAYELCLMLIRYLYERNL